MGVDVADLMRLSPDEFYEFNRTCDTMSETMSAEDACIRLAENYSHDERIAFMMGVALTLSLLGDGLLSCTVVDGVCPLLERY